MLEPLAVTADQWTAVGGMALAVLAVGEATRRGYRWCIKRIEDRGAKREIDKQSAKDEQERNAKLFAAATLINAMDGKLTAQTNSLTDTINTKMGALESKFDRKMDEHETKDVERDNAAKARDETMGGRLNAIEIQVKQNGNGNH